MKKVIGVILGVVLLVSMLGLSALADDPVKEAKIGETEYTTLAEAITAANADPDVTTIDLLKDVTVTELDITEAMVLRGNGKTITTNDSKKTFEVYADFTLENVIVRNNAEGGRCVDTRVGGITLTLHQVTLKATKSNTQPLTIGGNAGSEDEENRITVTVTDSAITAANHGYAIITYNPVDMLIEKSTVNGYAALYMKGADNSVGSQGSFVTVTESTLQSSNPYPKADGSNTFATIVLEAEEIGVEIDAASTVSAQSSGGSHQALFGFSKTTDGEAVFNCMIAVEPGAKLSATATNDEATASIVSGKVMDIASEEGNAVIVPSVYAPELYNDGNGYLLVIDDESGVAMILMSHEDFIATIGHTHGEGDLTKVEAVAPTCTKPGIKEHYVCDHENCDGATYGDARGSTVLLLTEVEPTGHSVIAVDAVAATTEKEGHIAHFACEECGTLFADEDALEELDAEDVVIPKLTVEEEPKPDETPKPEEAPKPEENVKLPATGESTAAATVAVLVVACGAMLVFSRKCSTAC